MSSVPFDPEAIRTLAAILAETGLTEIEIAQKDSRIRVVRAAASVPAAPVAVATVPVSIVETPPASLDDAPQFVLPGQVVTAGQTLLLIEAMKTFNQIKAPKAGTVARILVPAGAPVEYGEPLVILEG